MADAHVYRDPRPLAGTVVVFMWVFLVATVVSLFAVVFETLHLTGAMPSNPVPDSGGLTLAELIASFTRLGSFVLYVVTGVLCLRWFYRVTANARTFNPGMKAKPGWAVGWFFVPIAFLWKPFEYFSETWRVSHQPAAPAGVDTPGLLRWWWGLWLTMLIADNVSGRLSMMGGPDTMVVSNVFELLADAVTIPLTLLVIRILRALSAQQAHTHDLGDQASVFA